MLCRTPAQAGLPQWQRLLQAEGMPRPNGALVRCTLDERRPAAHVAVTGYALDDELILYRDVTGECFALNHTGAYVWSPCGSASTCCISMAEEGGNLTDFLRRSPLPPMTSSSFGRYSIVPSE